MSDIIKAAKEYICQLFEDNSDGHDTAHSLRVYLNALEICKAYPECDKMVVELAALLHDVDDHKLFNTSDNRNARAFLESQDVNEGTVDRICDVINGVSFSKNKGVIPKTIEGKIVQDADRLDAMGAIGIARTFAYGGRAGRTMESSRQHFDEKLLLLKDMINTEAGRRMAEERHNFMKAFLEEYDMETDVI